MREDGRQGGGKGRECGGGMEGERLGVAAVKDVLPLLNLFQRSSKITSSLKLIFQHHEGTNDAAAKLLLHSVTVPAV